jgi:FMN phosphatase YigB (HAD superfamily)
MTRKTLQFDPPIHHLLVDLDGTLLGNRSFRLSVDFVQRAVAVLKSYGGVRKAMKTLYEIQAIFKRPHPEFTNDQRVIELFAKRMNVSLEESRRILREGLFVIFPNLKKHFYPIEGAKEFLEWAKDRYPMTLTTNPVWPEEIVRMRVQWAGIDPSIFNSITHVRTMQA